jgi:hypothetical protein
VPYIQLDQQDLLESVKKIHIFENPTPTAMSNMSKEEENSIGMSQFFLDVQILIYKTWLHFFY